ncbi:Protein YceI [Cupriavidus campinensis]|uniref:YceI family protein n=1 Tax=Cupriavidus campinensis TaxID=151783 RepID=UPI001B1C42AF|nr:YceI family protein [Cupriavidus campinensis]CAG2129098.1 Protein YceI [Cupriavidus campinensis]
MHDFSLWSYAARRRVIAGIVFATFSLLAGAVGQARPTDVDLLPAHYVLQRANVFFDVNVSHKPLRMRFTRVDAQLERGVSGDYAQVAVKIDVASVETRPRFLSPIVRGSGMLDEAHYPEIRFVSTRFVRDQAGSGWLHGDLTMHGVVCPVDFLVTQVPGAIQPPNDGPLEFAASGDISLQKFGLSTWFPGVSDAVHVTIDVAFAQAP